MIWEVFSNLDGSVTIFYDKYIFFSLTFFYVIGMIKMCETRN